MSEINERVARVMRKKYAEMTGETSLVDFEVSRAREEWLACAKAAIEEMHVLIQAETERCAKICDKNGMDSRGEATAMGEAQNYTAANHWNAHGLGCEECAAQIRSQPDTSKGTA